MEIRQLEYFLMVARTGSFTRAAERLYVSQPSVTNAVRSLEEELGVQLFDRTQKQALLTAEGEVFKRHVEPVMQGISTTLSEINALKDLNGGVLQVGVAPLGGLVPAAALLQEYRACYPNIRVALTEEGTEELLRRVLADKLELAFVEVYGGAAALPGGLRQLPLPGQELVAVCARRHPLHRQNSVALQQLAGEPLVLQARGSCRSRVLAAFAGLGQELEPAFTAEQVQTMKSLAAAGAAVALLPELLVEDDDGLTAVALEPPLYLEPQLVCRRARQLSRAAQAFWELAERGVKENG